EAEIERATRKPAERLDAYDCVLRGTKAVHEEAYEVALPLFRHAMELDPDYAAACAFTARCYAQRHQEGLADDRAWEELETRRLALKVQSLGRDDAVALCWAGHSIAFVCREYEFAAAMIDRALLLNPNLAAAWQNRGIVSIYMGDYETGIEQLSHALRLNPLDPLTFRAHTFIGYANLLKGNYPDALIWAGKAIAQQPAATAPLRVAVAANALVGNNAEARKFALRLLQIAPQTTLSHLRSIAPYRRT